MRGHMKASWAEYGYWRNSFCLCFLRAIRDFLEDFRFSVSSSIFFSVGLLSPVVEVTWSDEEGEADDDSHSNGESDASGLITYITGGGGGGKLLYSTHELGPSDSSFWVVLAIVDEGGCCLFEGQVVSSSWPCERSEWSENKCDTGPLFIGGWGLNLAPVANLVQVTLATFLIWRHPRWPQATCVAPPTA